MLGLNLGSRPGGKLQVLCLGAHCDDIEIGCGGTILKLIAEREDLDFHWVVLSSNEARSKEARRSADEFLRHAGSGRILGSLVVKDFRNGYFPHVGAAIKDFFEELHRELSPDLVLTPYRDDRHQDHRVVSDLTWQTFRDHLILEYEIPKYDGDLGSPNLFVPLDERLLREKVRILSLAFASQQDKHWFTEDTFRGLMRLRGIECRAPGAYAEAFYARKLVLG